MDAGLRRAALALLLALATGAAQADLYLCLDRTGHRRIQDKPCAGGQRTESHAKERGSGSRALPPPPAGGRRAASSSGKTPIDIGIDKNRGVICQLLNREKSDTEAQIRGEAAAPAGEDPKDNLVKIERQRSRVGCAAG